VEIPDMIKKDLCFHFVEHMDEVLKLALIDPNAPPQPALEPEPAVPSDQPLPASV